MCIQIIIICILICLINKHHYSRDCFCLQDSQSLVQRQGLNAFNLMHESSPFWKIVLQRTWWQLSNECMGLYHFNIFLNFLMYSSLSKIFTKQIGRNIVSFLGGKKRLQLCFSLCESEAWPLGKYQSMIREVVSKSGQKRSDQFFSSFFPLHWDRSSLRIYCLIGSFVLEHLDPQFRASPLVVNVSWA